MIPISTDTNIKEPFKTLLMDLPWMKSECIPTMHIDKMPKYLLGINTRGEYMIYGEFGPNYYELFRFNDHELAIKQLHLLYNINNPYDLNQGFNIYYALIEFFTCDISIHELIMDIIAVTQKGRIKDLEISNMNTLAYEYNIHKYLYTDMNNIDKMFFTILNSKWYDGIIYRMYNKLLDNLLEHRKINIGTWNSIGYTNIYNINLSDLITSLMKDVEEIWQNA
jgi:hypothetical protein